MILMLDQMLLILVISLHPEFGDRFNGPHKYDNVVSVMRVDSLCGCRWSFFLKGVGVDGLVVVSGDWSSRRGPD